VRLPPPRCPPATPGVRLMPAPRRPNGRCSVCRHQEVARIDLLLAGGASFAAASRKFGLHKNALARHWTRHVSTDRRAQLVAGPLRLSELAERAAEENKSLIEYLAIVRSALLSQFLAASEADDRQGAALISARLLECLRMVGQITGDLQRTAGSTITNNNLFVTPMMAQLEQMLVRVLKPFPEAAEAVLRGLDELSLHAINGNAAAPSLGALEAPAA
jgi:transposase-like protein